MSISNPTGSKHHVFVDFENVQQVDSSVFGSKAVSFTLLLGAKQTWLDVTLVERLMEHAASVQLVRLTSSGRDAVDFALAYYLGRSVLAAPTAYFHVVSKDTGFDPLIEHLRSRDIRVARHVDFTTLPFSRAAKVPQAGSEDPWNRVLAHLRKNTNNRPKARKTLTTHLLSFVGHSATEADISALIEKLRNDGHISLGEKDGITYNM